MNSPSPKLLNFKQDRLSQNIFLWSNFCKIDVIIASVIEVLTLSNLVHMTISTIQFEARDKIFLMAS